VLTDKLIASTAPISAEGADEVYEVADAEGDLPQSEIEAEED
jgi:hypothetical protein